MEYAQRIVQEGLPVARETEKELTRDNLRELEVLRGEALRFFIREQIRKVQLKYSDFQ